MKEFAGCAVKMLLLATAAALFSWAEVYLPTRHLIATLPQTVTLHPGMNTFSFPAMRGRYLLTIGREDMEPAAFLFAVQGIIRTPAEAISFKEVYQPAAEGRMVRQIDISKWRTQVRVQLFAVFPRTEHLSCMFHGIK